MTPVAESRYRPAANVHSKPLGKAVVILDFASGDYFSLDDVGAVIWQGIERGASVGEIAAALVTSYDVSLDDAFRDVTELVGQLAARFLIVGSHVESESTQ